MFHILWHIYFHHSGEKGEISMPRKKTSVTKIKEVLRLSLKENLAQRDISKSTRIGKTTVQEILTRAKSRGITWEQIRSFSEDTLENLIYGKKEDSKYGKPIPDWAFVRLELMKKGSTLAQIWMDYKDKYPNGYQYSGFCTLYKKWEKESRLTLRQNHVAGERLFVDFSGLKVPYIYEPTGEIKEAEIFVAALGASNYTFVKATKDQTLENWIYSHCDAFKYFEGVPQIVVPDNLKSGVSKACRYDPDTNPTYLAMAEFYETAIIPTRAAKPRDKAKVEVAVQIVQRWILSILRKQTFSCIEEINEAILPLLKNLNEKKMKHLDASRKELWERYEKQALKPLPRDEFEIPIMKIAKVNIDYHVEFQRNYFSVPFKYVGQHVMIKSTKSLIQVFFKSEIIAIHAKTDLTNKSGKHFTIHEHMPEKHQEYLKWTPERILEWAKNSGKNTMDFCDLLMKNRAHPEQGYRACLGVLRLGEKFSKSRLDLACKIALERNSIRYRVVEDILRYEKDKSYAKKHEELKSLKTPVPHHENIRGANYFI